MSKRFGRNQKRRMRQEIADARLRVQVTRGLVIHRDEKIRELKGVIDDAMEVAGRMSVIFPAEEMTQRGSPVDTIQLAESDGPFFSGWQAAVTKAYRLRVLLASISKDALDGTVHARVRFGDQSWGYAISDQALASVPEELLSRLVAEELSVMIARDLSGGQRRQAA